MFDIKPIEYGKPAAVITHSEPVVHENPTVSEHTSQPRNCMSVKHNLNGDIQASTMSEPIPSQAPIDIDIEEPESLVALHPLVDSGSMKLR
jgi:hypothetical protein